MADHSKRHGRFLGMGRPAWHLLITSAIFVVLALLVYAGFQGREVARRQQRRGSMESIVRALSNHNDNYHHLPSPVHRDRSGKPLCSWRFALMTYVEQDVVGRCPDELWFDPVNYVSADARCSHFCFPWYGKTQDARNANVSLVTGPGTPFDGGWWSLEDLDPDTILVVEVASLDNHWMEPGDLQIDQLSPTLTMGLDGKGLHVGFADEQVWLLDPSVPLTELIPFFTVRGAKQFDREKRLGPYRLR